MLVKINESMAEDKFKDPTINKDAALWNDTRPHYNVGHVVPERDVKFEVIKGHEDHGPQPILIWNGKRLRPRAEMIVFNSKTGEILIRDNPSYKNSNVPFELPGGGLMEGKSFLETAIIEVKQEVRMNVRDAWDSHIYYINQSPDGTEQEWTTWGDYSQICCGICDSLYTGEIDDQDKDEDMARYAKWVKIEEVNLTPAHEEAIREYKRYMFSVGNSGYQVVKEATIHESKSDTKWRLISSDYTRIEYKSFDTMVKGCTSLSILYNLIKQNGVIHRTAQGMSIFRQFLWPEMVFEEKTCNCAELSTFINFICSSHNMNTKIVATKMIPIRDISMKNDKSVVETLDHIIAVTYAKEIRKWIVIDISNDNSVFQVIGNGNDPVKDIIDQYKAGYLSGVIGKPDISKDELNLIKDFTSEFDDRDYAILHSMHKIGNITHVQFNLGIPTIKKLNDRMHEYKNSIKCLRGVKKVIFHSNDYMEYIYNKHHKKNK